MLWEKGIDHMFACLKYCKTHLFYIPLNINRAVVKNITSSISTIFPDYPRLSSTRWSEIVHNVLFYNNRLLMRSTHNHEDRFRYWLTYGVGQPIPDKVFMVMSRPKLKVIYRFMKSSGIFLHKVWRIHNCCFIIALAEVSLAQLKIDNPNTPLNAVCGVFTLRYTPVNAVSANQRRANQG